MLPFDAVYHPPHSDDTPQKPVPALPEPLRIFPRKTRTLFTLFRKP